MRNAVLWLAAAGIGLFAASSNFGGTVRRQVVGHRFEIPQELFYDQRIAWLPAPERDSFVFLLEPNPDRDRIPQHRILVEPLGHFCPTESKTEATQMLRIVCGQEEAQADDAPPYIHENSKLDYWASDLYSVSRRPTTTGKKARRPIAYCQTFEPNLANPNRSTMCTTFWAMNDLKLQFSFDLNEAAQLPQMKAKASRLLTEWEVH